MIEIPSTGWGSAAAHGRPLPPGHFQLNTARKGIPATHSTPVQVLRKRTDKTKEKMTILRFNRIKTLAALTLAVLMALTLASCIYDGDAASTDAPTDAPMQIKFTIVMDNNDAATRAGEDDDNKNWGDDHAEEAATEWENTIQSGKLKVMVFDKDSCYVGQVVNLTPVRHTGADNNVYDVIGDLQLPGGNVDHYTLDGKIVVMANYDPNFNDIFRPGFVTTGTRLSHGWFANQVYSFQQHLVNNRTQNIPMFGVKSFKGAKALTFVKGYQQNAGKIYMIRAMAKIRLLLSQKLIDQGWKLETPTVSCYNQQGCIFPGGYATAANTENLGLESSLHIPENVPNSVDHPVDGKASWPFTLIDASTWRYVLYLPEYKNADKTDGDARDLYVTYRLTRDGSTPIEGRCYIGDYENGQLKRRRNVVRNTIYEYMLTVPDEQNARVTLKYRVVPWTEVTGSITFN